MMLPSLASAVVLGTLPSPPVQTDAYDPRVIAFAHQIAAGEDKEGLAGLSALADDGNMDAHNMLGEVYGFGLGKAPLDRSRSCEHFRIARKSNPSAAHNHGQCLWEGAYGERRFQEARVWYQRGADGGFPQSKCALGNMMIKGEGGAVDTPRGLALCREAAEAGEPNAQTDVGDYYGGGVIVAQNYREARRWYGLAAAQGQRNALFNLGIFDWNGFGGDRNLESASKWFEAAYAGGRLDAALLVGRANLIQAVPNPPGDPIDAALLEKAKSWFTIALENDPAEASRAQAAVALAQISGYEALIRHQISAP